MIEHPCPCSTCTEEDWQDFGCGFHGHEGQASHTYAFGASDEPMSRTCPRYCLSFPFVDQVYSDVNDYEHGALGNVLDLEAPYADYLRAASQERERWRGEMDWQEAQLYQERAKQ